LLSYRSPRVRPAARGGGDAVVDVDAAVPSSSRTRRSHGGS
jgi:hypothetical protein